MNRGKRLKPGDTIGVIAPAGSSTVEKIERACQVLESLGYHTAIGPGGGRHWQGFAGRDTERAEEFNTFFADPRINALLCLRGGYGALRLAEAVDWQGVKTNPKVFIGYSDITFLHVVLNQVSELITFHGPMLTANLTDDFDDLTRDSFEQVLARGVMPFEIDHFGTGLDVLRGGQGEGRIIGGNLTTLMATMGTPYEIKLEGKILFLEEVNEATYRIDRFLTQLRLSGKLRGVQGIVLGDFKNCGPATAEDFTLEEVFEDRLTDLNIPVVCHFPSGHCRPMATLPLGALARLDTDRGRLTILEAVVD